MNRPRGQVTRLLVLDVEEFFKGKVGVSRLSPNNVFKCNYYIIIFFSPEPILVIVRLAENGCLLSHLRKTRERQYINFKAESAVHFTPVDKITIARDVANGMWHLSNKKVKIYIFFCILHFP